MKVYSCKVRLYGEPRDEVQKLDVTAAEIRVLRHIHGDDGVVNIAEAGWSDNDETKERDRLDRKYGDKVVSLVFGAPVARVEDELPPVKKEVAEAPKAEFTAEDRKRRKERMQAQSTDALLD